ncbi:MAG: Asp23/Gls24 family envelope stress response protein [Clostridiales bacterium]|nr:Asp23/Gls24 family envelope stress response protein [Clostridiales bacterium]
MGENLVSESIKGERSMSQGFVAQYAAEAALRTEGVACLTASVPVALKESLGFVHEGKGVRVEFSETEEGFVSVTVYPIVYYGMIIPEVAWSIQERVKEDIEKFTGLVVASVNVHVCGVVLKEEKGS